MNPTSIHEDAGFVLGPTWWVKDLALQWAVACVGHICSLVLVLWLWHRPAAAGLIWSLAWKLPKKKKKGFTALKIPCAPNSSLPTSDLTLCNHWPFIVSIVLPFLEYHIVGVVKYVALSDCIFSVGIMRLRFLHVFSWLDSLISLLFQYWIITVCCLDMPSIICLFICWRTSCWLLPSFSNYE